ncbi:uncharacterized protein PHACADRAFT_124468 [Phanerochaete carnosa HHB-10118-sp]|uniref:Fungal-type protein kinase domain-containing protein n=1 Tax=Phanerochaete carnosa (strain HHB-10118-sp) TaxID=650164 RepID=K5WRJ8_PHACS|nr:uncharacterized protein PHACADRAFT_124468 [Phanerochaete carnosa HHB-10118-sp]EKM53007.1 hypothetical protein PHACADRAFT_124468 [Phanerochaete carnosa HHB-10118-sp]
MAQRDRSRTPPNPPGQAPTNMTPNQPQYARTAPPDLGLKASRSIVVEDLKESVPSYSADYFFQAYLPPLDPDIDLDAVLQYLGDNGHITYNQLDAFRRVLPATRRKAADDMFADPHKTEDVVFAQLEPLAEAVTAAVKSVSANSNREPTVRFKCRLTSPPKSSDRSNTSKPDAYGIRSEAPRNGRAEWVDIAVPGEFKTAEGESKTHDNRVKVLWSLNHIMREDARRRFVIGFTIEGDRMRLWFASRSEVVASWPFNFIMNPRRFVEFLLRIMYAGEADLGWDTTIRRLTTPDGHTQLEITVNNKKYRTLRLISSIGADSLRGRGTRVWEVVQVDGDGNFVAGPFALKDSWVDSDRVREWQILHRIRVSGSNERHNTCFENHLPHILEHWDVLVNDSPDDTHNTMRRAVDATISTHRRALPVLINPSVRQKVMSKHPAVGAFNMPEATKQPLDFAAKTHHRVVFKGVGKSIVEVESMEEAFRHLRRAVLVLCCLHECGWVHRDISSGNILVVGKNVVISDVEYAKRMSDTTVHTGVRTGTAFFMPVEIDNHGYLFDSEDAAEDDSPVDYELAFAELELPTDRTPSASATPPAIMQVSMSLAQDSQPQPPPALFQHNYLHDLESHLWLSLYVLICGKIRDSFQDRPEVDFNACMQRHGDLAVNLFCDRRFRLAVMTSSSKLKTELWGLLPQIMAIAPELDQVRTLIATRYRQFEHDLGTVHMMNATEMGSLYVSIHKRFGTMVNLLKNNNLHVVVDSTPFPFEERMHQILEENAIKDADGRVKHEAKAADDDDDDEQARSRKRPRVVADASAPSSVLPTHDVFGPVQQTGFGGPSTR